MNKLLIALGLCALSVIAQAEQALSKDVIERFVTAQQAWEQLDKTNPELIKALDALESVDEGSLADAKKLNGFGDLEKQIQGFGFEGVGELYEVSQRFMGAVFAVQIEANPQMEGMLSASPQFAKMKKAMDSASSDDKQFVKDNMTWIQAQMQAMDQ